MKLYTAKLAPNPRRVQLFLAEKGIRDLDVILLDLGKLEHTCSPVSEVSPAPQLPVLELDDGRRLSESRAICGYLESRYPEPNLFGRDGEERAFIEMADRQAEFFLLVHAMNAVRHSHPGFANIEQPQLADFGRTQVDKLRRSAAWYEALLGRQAYVAGDRFTVADITAFCALEFVRGLLKFVPANEGFANLQAYRDRIAERPSVKA
jgi:glutathione S-transferase